MGRGEGWEPCHTALYGKLWSGEVWELNRGRAMGWLAGEARVRVGDLCLVAGLGK